MSEEWNCKIWIAGILCRYILLDLKDHLDISPKMIKVGIWKRVNIKPFYLALSMLELRSCLNKERNLEIELRAVWPICLVLESILTSYVVKQF